MLTISIPNLYNEKLDTLVEGNAKAKVTIIFVHGFATDKHETAHYFDDLSDALKNHYRIVRFDFSGCGKSEGKTLDINYHKHSQDLNCVIDYVKNNFSGELYILAQSMGCFITSVLSPTGIKKTVFTGLPNSNTLYIAERLKERFGLRPGGKIDFNGLSVFPRSTGKSQLIGQSFWKEMFNLNPVEKVMKYSKKTDLLVIHPKQDEIVGSKYLAEYSDIPALTVKWLDGDHSFKRKKDRKLLIDVIRQFFTFSN